MISAVFSLDDYQSVPIKLTDAPPRIAFPWNSDRRLHFIPEEMFRQAVPQDKKLPDGYLPPIRERYGFNLRRGKALLSRPSAYSYPRLRAGHGRSHGSPGSASYGHGYMQVDDGPPAGCGIPASILIVVDFPAPFGPI